MSANWYIVVIATLLKESIVSLFRNFCPLDTVADTGSFYLVALDLKAVTNGILRAL